MTIRGCYLVARVTDVRGFWDIASGQVLLEDLSGKVAMMTVYNEDKEHFSQRFALGRELCVIEPFYKIRNVWSALVASDCLLHITSKTY